MDSADKDIFRFLDLPVELQTGVLELLIPEKLEVIPVETTESFRHGPSTPKEYVLTFSAVERSTYQTIRSLRAVSQYIRQQWSLLLQRATLVLRVNMISCQPTTLDASYDAGFIPKAMMSVLRMFRDLSDLEIVNRHYVEVGSAGQAFIRQYQLQSSIKLSITESGASRFAVRATIISQSMATFRCHRASLEERKIIKTHMRHRLCKMAKRIFGPPYTVRQPDHIWELCNLLVKTRPSVMGGSPTRHGNTSRSRVICPIFRSQQIVDAKADFAIPDSMDLGDLSDKWMLWEQNNTEFRFIGKDEESHIKPPLLHRNSHFSATHWSTSKTESNAEFVRSLNDSVQMENRICGAFRMRDQKLLFQAGGHEFHIRGKERRMASKDDVRSAEAVAVLRKEFMESRFGTSEIDNRGMD